MDNTYLRSDIMKRLLKSFQRMDPIKRDRIFSEVSIREEFNNSKSFWVTYWFFKVTVEREAGWMDMFAPRIFCISMMNPDVKCFSPEVEEALGSIQECKKPEEIVNILEMIDLEQFKAFGTMEQQTKDLFWGKF